MSELQPEFGASKISDASKTSDTLPTRASRRNEGFAYQAIRHVHSTLGPRALAHPDAPAHHVPTEGAARWMLGRFEQVWMLGHEAETVAAGGEEAPTATVMHRMQRTIERSLADGSGAHAAVAFAYLLKLGVRPLDFMHTPGRRHAFVLIGRAAEGASETHVDDEAEMLIQPDVAPLELQPEAWGADAVVCDAYTGLVLRQPEIINTSYYFDYTPSESQLCVPAGRDPVFGT
jgi:hypothetical protein